MGKRLTNNGTPLYYSLDVGNGETKGISNVELGEVRFEPVIAPITRKKGVSDEKPSYTLRLKDKSVSVYGVEDVFAHGQRDSIRRLNSTERYTSPDYFNLIHVLLLHVFPAYRGHSEYIKPTGAISIPIEQFNNEETVEEIFDTLTGKHEIIDNDGCELRIHIHKDRLHILPESTGAIVHWAFDPSNLKRRADTSGSTLVIDPGYETTDCSLFEGMRYIRDRAQTFRRSGMGNVTRAVLDYTRSVIRDADVSRVDVAMRGIAGMKPGSAKMIEPTPGKFVDVSPVYDTAIFDLGQRIADDVRTHYTEDVTRVLLAGGGAYHLSRILRDLLPFDVEVAPTPEMANVYGALTTLKIKSETGR